MSNSNVNEKELVSMLAKIIKTANMHERAKSNVYRSGKFKNTSMLSAFKQALINHEAKQEEKHGKIT
tara:strand:- start:428 stop:628 length:201 start_codon:yes stop_codon:yes gene_type:complete